MIGEVALAIEMGADEVDIGKTIHPHPTLGESIGMAAECRARHLHRPAAAAALKFLPRTPMSQRWRPRRGRRVILHIGGHHELGISTGHPGCRGRDGGGPGPRRLAVVVVGGRRRRGRRAGSLAATGRADGADRRAGRRRGLAQRSVEPLRQSLDLLREQVRWSRAASCPRTRLAERCRWRAA
jgi:hypothetical protein